MEPITDYKLIELLRSIDRVENDRAMSFLYQKLYVKVSSHVLRNSGRPEDAADLFQDGLIVLYKAVRQMKIPDDTNIQGYLFAICRNLWLKRWSRQKKQQPLTKEYEDIPSEVSQLEMLISKEKEAAIQQILERLGGKCRQLLLHFYYDRLRMKEIVEIMGFSSEQVAKNKKSACMKKLRSLLDEQPAMKNLLKKG